MVLCKDGLLTLVVRNMNLRQLLSELRLDDTAVNGTKSSGENTLNGILSLLIVILGGLLNLPRLGSPPDDWNHDTNFLESMHG